MEGHCSTGQSPQGAVVSMEEAEEVILSSIKHTAILTAVCACLKMVLFAETCHEINCIV